MTYKRLERASIVPLPAGIRRNHRDLVLALCDGCGLDLENQRS